MAELEALYFRWHARVEGLARQLLFDRDDAAEAAQEVFVEAWRRLPQYDPNRGTEWAWLRRIAQTRCLDRLRAAQRRKRAAVEAAVQGAEESEVKDGERWDVATLLAQLPDAQRVPIELSYLGGFSHREIAARTNQPLGTVKTRIRMGMARLASLLQPRRARGQDSSLSRAGDAREAV